MQPLARIPLLDANPGPGPFPLVVVSHGNGGTGAIYRGLASHLSRNGFIVALPDHPGNTRSDDGLARTRANLEQRPRHIMRVIDWAYAESPCAPRLRPDSVAIIGHSLGGYTALALAGGRPTMIPYGRADDGPRVIDVPSDPRIKALVLLAPATAWFGEPHALDDVRVPILLLSAEHDAHTPAFHGEIVARGVPDARRLEVRTIANAGHFSFLDPFPTAFTKRAPAAASDPPGFDRAAFGTVLAADVRDFLQRVFENRQWIA